jgi:hypothetical protein
LIVLVCLSATAIAQKAPSSQIIIKNLRNAGSNCGSMATTDGKGRPIWVVAAERSDAGRFIVHAHDMPIAFVELEAAIHAYAELS